MVNIFKKIDSTEKPQFSMPLSLRIIKECASCGIDWRYLHIVDLFSIIYSIRIDKAKEYLERKRQERLRSRGIAEVKKATEADFDNL